MRFPRLSRFVRNPWVQDTALVMPLVLISAGGFVSAAAYGDTRMGWSAGLSLVSALPLILRRRLPVIVASVVVMLDAVAPLLVGPPATLAIQGMIALYAVGRYTAGRTAVISGAGAGVVYAIFALISHNGPAPPPLAVIGSIALEFLAPFLGIGLGQFVRLRVELKLRRQQEVRDEAIRGERRRIARELHDVVAHHLSVINALVGGARTVLPAESGEAREALTAAEQSARQALAEMRQLLQVLRADTAEGPDAATGVGACGLADLVSKSGNATLAVVGEAVALPTAVDHAVYRVVQEALTNSRKHAPGSRAGVRLAYLGKAVEVEVLDNGSPVKSAAGSSGYGLGGMAERVALCGGQLETGPRPRGGFRVYALLPLEKA